MSDSPNLQAYYRTIESRFGYQLFLGGAKHFGYFRPDDNPWAWRSAVHRMEDRLADVIDLPAGSRILDAGCGMGNISRHLAKTRGWHIVGVDLLDFNISTARKKALDSNLSKQLSYIQGDYIADLPGLEGGSFDAVYNVETFVHVNDIDTGLLNFKRLLKPGGRLVQIEYDRLSDEQLPPRAAKVFKRINDLSSMPAFDQVFINGGLAAHLETTGFESIVVEDLTPNMLPMLKTFRTVAYPPYLLALALKKGEITKGSVNVASAVEFWRYRGMWRYLLHQSRKPI